MRCSRAASSVVTAAAGDLRLAVRVGRARRYAASAGRPDRPMRTSMATAPSAAGARRPGGAKADGFTVVRERHVEEDDPPLDAIARGFEFLETADDDQFGFDAGRRGADAVAEAEHHERLRDRAGDLQALAPADPVGHLDRLGWTFSRPSRFISSTAQLDRGVEVRRSATGDGRTCRRDRPAAARRRRRTALLPSAGWWRRGTAPAIAGAARFGTSTAGGGNWLSDSAIASSSGRTIGMRGF